MNYGSKLYQCLIFDPSVGIIQTPLKKVNALCQLFKFIISEVFNEIGQIFNANLSDSPDVVIVEVFEGIEYFVNEYRIVKMLAYRDESRKQELFDLEQHPVPDVWQVLLQETFALGFFKNVLFRELLNDNKNCDFSFLFDVFSFLMLAIIANSVHDNLNNFLYQILSLLFRNVLFGKIEYGLNALHLDRLLW